MPKKRAGGADGAAAKKSRTDEIPRMTKVRKTLALPEVLRSVNKLKSSVPRRLCHFGRFAAFAALPAFFLFSCHVVSSGGKRYRKRRRAPHLIQLSLLSCSVFLQDPSDSFAFPLDLSSYRKVKINPFTDTTLSESQKADLAHNIQLCRDAIVFFTAMGAASGYGGHTGGAYDTVPEVMMMDAFFRTCPDRFVPIFFDEAGHRVATQYLMSSLEGHIDPELLRFYRKGHNKLPGHPELGLTYAPTPSTLRSVAKARLTCRRGAGRASSSAPAGSGTCGEPSTAWRWPTPARSASAWGATGARWRATTRRRPGSPSRRTSTSSSSSTTTTVRGSLLNPIVAHTEVWAAGWQ